MSGEAQTAGPLRRPWARGWVALALSATVGVMMFMGVGTPAFAVEEPCEIVEMDGVIESLPADGLVGDWVIGGVTVHVTGETELVTGDHVPEVGDGALVRGCADGEAVTALSVKVFPHEEPCDGMRLEGVIEALPDGLIGEWVVSGRTVLVTEDTEFHPEGADPEVGSEVVVEGCVREGVLVALFIKVFPHEEPCDGMRLEGVIEALPDGLIGEWVVSGQTVLVTEETEFHPEGADPQVGSEVVVEGCVREGVLVALFIKVFPHEEPCDGMRLEGVIEALPDGLIGEWVVSGRTVLVTEETDVHPEGADPAVGSEVVVEGCVREGVLVALFIKVFPHEEPCDVVEMDGIIESLPAEGLIGDWIVSGVTVHVCEDTEIHVRDHRVPEIGDEVLVRGCADGEAVKALSVKVFPHEEPCDEMRLEGEIEALPDGLIGEWVVSGRTVLVTEETDFHPESADPEVGSEVIVEGCVREDVLVANLIKVIPREDPCEKTRHEGVIEALPDEGLIGDWTVSGVIVRVFLGTDLDDEHGPFVVGARVLVVGCTAEDGVLLAREVETLPEPCEKVRLKGIVEALPDGGLIGDWIVSGVVVHVTEDTEIEDAHGPVEVGAEVVVHGCAVGEGEIDAREIGVVEGEPNECGIEGVIESLPAEGLVGDWVVADRIVHVSEETTINQELGAVELGAVVEVEGACEEDGSLTAWRIKVEGDDDEGEGGGHPEASSFAVLHLTPTAAAPDAEGVALVRLFVREDGSEHEDLKVCVEHVAADSFFDVFVDGLNIGAIQTNLEGEGCLFLSTRDVDGAEPLPSELRPVTEVGQVDVFDSSALLVLTGNFADADWHERTHPRTDFLSVALLRDDAGMVIGMVVAKASEDEDEQEVQVKVWNLEPSSPYAIVLDGSELAVLMTDLEGNLEGEFASPAGDDLLLPDLFLPVSALLHADLLAGDGTVVASGDFGDVAPAEASSTAGSARGRRGGR